MKNLIIENQDDIAVLTLDNGPTNALSPDLISELSAALEELQSVARGVVIGGGTKFFSIGFDLPTLIKMDRSRMTDFWSRFNALILQLYALPMPSIAVLCGHAVAGGNILALACDFRFCSQDPAKKIGLNEIQLGLPVPLLADMILRQVVGERRATEMMIGGDFMSFADAVAIDMIDAAVADNELKQAAIEKVAALAVSPQFEAYGAIKYNRTDAIRKHHEIEFAADSARFLDCWFSEATQQLLQTAAARF